jgi:8-oxo-dGTP diphosphatase
VEEGESQEAPGLVGVKEDGETVQAAGGVVWRRRHDSHGGVEVLLVHRPKYDDWSLPKGKLSEGESHRDAAAREVLEETGLRCTIGPELPSTRYRDHLGRLKVVRYWAMEAQGGEFAANHEVDEARWLPLDEAPDALTYDHDRAVLAAVPR